MGILLCVAAFLLAFLAGRKSLVAGLTTVLAIGYVYGLLRANFPDPASHFIFDAAVVALYATQLFHRQPPDIVRNTRTLMLWFMLLFAWPVVMLFVPLQDAMVQLVGLRGNIFLLPFLVIGARLRREEIARLAFSLAILNLAVFAVTAVEYRIGIEPFFPRNTNTEIIYSSADVGAGDQYRIPSTFTGSHAYAGTMVMTLPFLLGAWAMADTTRRRRVLLICASVAAILGVFAAASRVHTIVLAVVLVAAFFSGTIAPGARALLFSVLTSIGIVVLGQERLQRFRTLEDTSFVSQRIVGSVNSSFWDLLFQYPLGNGLGGGGTSLPFFLQDRVRDRVTMENEYARILLEQSVIGLCLWVAFIGWFVSRRFSAARTGWQMGEHLAWIACCLYFGSAMIGTGLLTSIPQTALLLICAGWVSSRAPAEWEQFDREAEFAARAAPSIA
jgi:hypothetical protein